MNIKSSKNNVWLVHKAIYENKLHYLAKTKKEENGESTDGFQLISCVTNEEEMKDFLLFNALATVKSGETAGMDEMQELYFLPNALAKLTKKEKESISLVGKGLTDRAMRKAVEISKNKKWHRLRRLNLA